MITRMALVAGGAVALAVDVAIGSLTRTSARLEAQLARISRSNRVVLSTAWTNALLKSR